MTLRVGTLSRQPNGEVRQRVIKLTGVGGWCGVPDTVPVGGPPAGMGISLGWIPEALVAWWMITILSIQASCSTVNVSSTRECSPASDSKVGGSIGRSRLQEGKKILPIDGGN